MQIFAVAAGIGFLIYARGKNFVYNRGLILLGLGCSLLLLWVMFDVPLDRIADNLFVPYLISFCGPGLVFGSLCLLTKYEEDFFETRTLFVIKKRYYYKDVTGYKIEKYHSIKGPDIDELVLYFGEEKISIYIGPNYLKLLDNIKREYRKNHGGAEIPVKD